MKLLIRIVVVVVLLVVIAAVSAIILIDSIATTAVREGAAFATETDAACEKVDVKLFDAAADIEQLDIKNPDGAFRDKFDSFLVLGGGSAEIKAASVLSDNIVIPRVELSDIEINLVGLDDGTKNFETILASLKRFQGEEPPDKAKKQKKVVIKELVIHNIKVTYDFAKDPVLKAAPVSGTIVIADKEPLVFKDIGGDGSPISQVTAEIITDIMVQVTANLAGNIGDHLTDLTGSLADTVGAEELQGMFDDLDTDIDVSEQLDELSNAIKGAGDLIKGIPGLGGD